MLVAWNSLHGAEPWADPRLSPPDGLELWFDAAAIPRARSAAGQKPLESGQPLRGWPDASGRQHKLVQADAAAQPHVLRLETESPGRTVSEPWIVRFDGKDDHLRIIDFDRSFPEFTLFLVTAPHSNEGGFRGFLSANQSNRRDYETGFTVDMNYPYSAFLSDINIEGRGFGGARNLISTALPFGQLDTLETTASAERKSVQLVVNGQPGGKRDFKPGEIIADELTLGARYYENSNGPQRVQGFLQGDIAEVLLFNRALTDAETKTVRKYLDEKHAGLKAALKREREQAATRENATPLVTVTNPPPVQMLLPGFTVRELPVALRNINNLRYRKDGKLYALGYDGDVWLLSDQDGDGSEDTATRFFESKGRLRGPLGMQVIPPNHALLKGDNGNPLPNARGVVVASKGKVSALLDLDGDDVAETERIIATGWKEIPQNVDALGVAFDPRDGAIYFGLGTTAYNNAYLLDEKGKSAFDLNSDRGTIQRIEPDLSKRTTVCTGVRFTVGMEFNADGDLFVSEQEGATWLPNGNPFDELLHIQPGRHFGFPPRHPQHLPRVFDEPSVFDYGPQHQSTCGMAFNLPVMANGPTFGPVDWRGDLFMTGESRGKLYRTRVIKDHTGRYVADNQLIACLNLLTVECCVTPRGDLLIACHSGGPDWGTGPTGMGRIFRVSYDQPATPQPTAAWLTSPQELHVSFSEPLDPLMLKNLATEAKITSGEFVAAGDRFETIFPGYAVVQRQKASPRFSLPVYSASVTPDRRELILATGPHRAAVSYALELPGLGRESMKAAAGVLSQHPATDLAYSLEGVWAEWKPARAEQPGWSRSLPHVDFSATKRLGGPAASALAQALSEPGTLTLNTKIDSRGLFLPITQPGSQLDYAPGRDAFVKARHLVIRSRGGMLFRWGPELSARFQTDENALGTIKTSFDEEIPNPLPLSITITTPASPELEIEWQAELADGTTRSGPIALRRFLLPWAEATTSALDAKSATEPVIPELANARWGRGRRVFLSDEAGCAKCHLPDAAGRRIGPDLANLRHRDFASVQRDITQPSFAINPDYLGYTVVLTDGRVLTGTLHNAGDRLVIGDRDGKTVSVARSEIDELKPSPISVMPDGMPAKLGPDKMRDLLAFLLQPPPHMPSDAREPPPPLRTRAEVDAVLADSVPVARPAKPLNVLLVAGAKDHGPGEHDYPAWLREWSKLLEAAENVTVVTAMEWPTAEQLHAADTILFYQKGSWTPERAAAIDAHLAKGGGLIYIHWAVEAGPEAPAFAQRIGLASNAAKLKFRHGPLDLGFETGAKHPIGRHFSKVHFHDESYWQMQGDLSRIQVLATGKEDGMDQPLFWTLEPSGGRVFVSIPGHFSWTFDDPLFRVLLLRGIAWTAHEPVDRFNDLATLGVTFGP